MRSTPPLESSADPDTFRSDLLSLVGAGPGVDWPKARRLAAARSWIEHLQELAGQSLALGFAWLVCATTGYFFVGCFFLRTSAFADKNIGMLDTVLWSFLAGIVILLSLVNLAAWSWGGFRQIQAGAAWRLSELAIGLALRSSPLAACGLGAALVLTMPSFGWMPLAWLLFISGVLAWGACHYALLDPWSRALALELRQQALHWRGLAAQESADLNSQQAMALLHQGALRARGATDSVETMLAKALPDKFKTDDGLPQESPWGWRHAPWLGELLVRRWKGAPPRAFDHLSAAELGELALHWRPAGLEAQQQRRALEEACKPCATSPSPRSRLPRASRL